MVAGSESGCSAVDLSSFLATVPDLDHYGTFAVTDRVYPLPPAVHRLMVSLATPVGCPCEVFPMAHVQQDPASIREQQIAMSALAHTVRGDFKAVTALVDMIQDPDERVRPAFVIVALLAEFKRGIDQHDAEELALWFSHEAQALAAQADLT
ncbi:hypothetical protein ACQPW1_11295 [Nocardia sp. CA-128927]|uniref:hypothetical protein n=1 Tax=Nocardia sp. CA-128927 TaxID=3239975 RepID=UPI003D95BC59